MDACSWMTMSRTVPPLFSSSDIVAVMPEASPAHGIAVLARALRATAPDAFAAGRTGLP